MLLYDKLVAFRITKELKKILEIEAKDKGLDFSAYIRKIIDERKI